MRSKLLVCLCCAALSLGLRCPFVFPFVYTVGLEDLVLRYHEVNRIPVGGGVEIVFEGRLTNGGSAAVGARVAIAAAGPTGADVVDALFYFPPLAPGESMASGDLLRIRTNRPFDPNRLAWSLAPPAPALVASEPGSGEPIPRSEWLDLRFAAAVDAATRAAFQLLCDGAERALAVHALGASRLVVNPAGELPAEAACRLTWPGPADAVELAFTTAAGGPAARVVYDPLAPRATTPFPDDLRLEPDATATGHRVALPVPAIPGLLEPGTFAGLVAPVNRLDGFSPIAPIVVELEARPDAGSLPRTAAESLDPLATLGLFDLTPGSPGFGERVAFDLSARTDVAASPIAAPGAGDLGLADDGSAEVVFPAGFVFPFFGVPHTSVFVNANGSLTFGGADATYDPAVPAGVVGGLPRIAPFFVDLDPAAGGGVFAEQAADRLTVTWFGVPEHGGTAGNTFRAVLFADGRFELRYEGGVSSVGATRSVHVAVSPGGSPAVREADLDEDDVAIGPGEALLESFADDSFPLDGLFDLDGRVISFAPSGGGYAAAREIAPGSVASHTLLLFPATALAPEGRYGLVVTRRAQADPTRPLDPSDFFARVRDDPSDAADPPELTRVRALVDEVLAGVASATPPIPRDDVALALRLSVRSTDDVPTDLLSIRQQVFAGPPPACTVDPASILDLGNGALVEGTWQAPEWRGPAPAQLNQLLAFLGAPFTQDRVQLVRDALGSPIQQGTATLDFTVAVPEVPGGGAPIVMYQHGNPGSARSEIPGQAVGFADSGGETLVDAGFAVAGFTDSLNREVSPPPQTPETAGTLQAFALLAPVLITQAPPEYQTQSNADQIAFLRLLEQLGPGGGCELDVLPLATGGDGLPDVDPTSLVYLGISQGSAHAPGFLPYAPEVRAAAMVVAGGRLAQLLEHQAGDTLVAQLREQLPNLTPAEVWLGLSLFQTAFDRQDTENHAPRLYRDPLPLGTPGRASVLVVEGLGDGYVPPGATRGMAWALGPLPHVEPVEQATGILDSVPAPLAGNVDGATTAGFFQYVPAGLPGHSASPGCLGETQGHFCAQSAPEALDQRRVFFESALEDPAPTIVAPLP